MTDIILFLLLALVLVYGIIHTVRKARKGGGCCGEHETVSLTGAADKNKGHYPYEAELTIGGMTCENCARRVANALNALEGTWARVRLDTKKARVLSKEKPDEARLREAVARAGYVVMGYEETASKRP